MIYGAAYSQAAFLRFVTQHDATSCGVVGPRMKSPVRKGFGQPRIISIDGSARFLRRHLRRDHNRGSRIEERDRVVDCGYVPAVERDQTSRSYLDLFSCGSFPDDLAIQRAGLHVQPPVVFQQICIG